MMRPAHQPISRARLYQTVRTAHLERARELQPATIIYASRRYDFDERVAEGIHLIQAGAFHAAFLIATSPIKVLEINEPLMLTGVRRTAVVLFALDVRKLLGRPNPRVVTYTIENADLLSRKAPGFRSRLRNRIDSVLVRYVSSRVSRVVFGTESSQELYNRKGLMVAGTVLRSLIPALPIQCSCVVEGSKVAGGVLFLGAFTQRKGLPLVLDAWEKVETECPDATLSLIGTGELEDEVDAFVSMHPRATVTINPPRDHIHSALRLASVLVLPSQPRPRWREQVGLPIVEGLAHGCAIVTTDETGLASWLNSHGHHVVSVGGGAEELASAISLALRERRDAQSILEDLPGVDGRLAADEWLFSDS